MPYKDKEKQREYQRTRCALVRKEWFDKNGPCKECGNEENLELHHVDPKKKVTHRVWSWSISRREKELAKCVVLCRECHINKIRKPITHGSDSRGYDRGCRCDLCKAAHTQRCKEYRAKLPAIVPH